MSSSSVLELVESRGYLLDAEEPQGCEMAESTADTFTQSDRKELNQQGWQLAQIQKQLSAIEAAAKEERNTAQQAMSAHEARLRTLEDERLVLKTQMDISWRWMVVIAGAVGGGVSLLMKLIWH